MNVSFHPVLNRSAYLGAYVGVWFTLACLLDFLVIVSGGISSLESTVLTAPMAALFGTVALSAWYVCKATPLRAGGDARVFTTHLTAGLALSFLWIQIGQGYAKLLARSMYFAGIESRYVAHKPVLFVSGILLYLLCVGFFYVVVSIEASREAENRAAETVTLARDAELRALRAQINPHFLFNSLNSISALTSIDPERAREMCLLLADFLRLTLGMSERDVIPLSDEIGLLEKFMAIEKIRFGERLAVTEEVQEQAKVCLIPPLLLQPLLENAVSHGIASLADGGWIRLQAQVQDGRLGITVENQRDDEAPARRKNGVGLKNVRSRLEARYGKEASFRIEPSEDRFRVTMSIPAEHGEPR
ncbi:MAG TPA: histidine kinase [Candidatus Acidoferrum sp.]|nr:histidine kinase [Candidatus Acidoferrum sp.]